MTNTKEFKKALLDNVVVLLQYEFSVEETKIMKKLESYPLRYFDRETGKLSQFSVSSEGDTESYYALLKKLIEMRVGERNVDIEKIRLEKISVLVFGDGYSIHEAIVNDGVERIIITPFQF